MTFRFFCPQGHILEAEPQQVGQAAACPFCGTPMLIPAPLKPGDQGPLLSSISEPSGGEPKPSGLNGEIAAHREPPARLSLLEEEGGAFSASEVAGGSEGAREVLSASETPEAEVRDTERPSIPAVQPTAAPPALFHIPCPQGHVLEVPQEMLGTDAMCPFCRSVFRLSYESSQEYRAKLQRERELAERREAVFWLRLAIAAAVLVLIGLIALIVFAPR